jgi:hypothetical protein
VTACESHRRSLSELTNASQTEAAEAAVEAYLTGGAEVPAALGPAARAALEIVRPYFTGPRVELPSLRLWEPGELTPVAPGDERFAPYVGQLFHYAVWDALDDVDCSLSTIWGRIHTIHSLQAALGVEVVDALGVALRLACRLTGYYCSGEPYGEADN